MGFKGYGTSFTMINTLKTFTAIPTVEATIRFLLSRSHIKAQLHFIEVTLPLIFR